jgi:hypothetical protein
MRGKKQGSADAPGSFQNPSSKRLAGRLPWTSQRIPIRSISASMALLGWKKTLREFVKTTIIG